MFVKKNKSPTRRHVTIEQSRANVFSYRSNRKRIEQGTGRLEKEEPKNKSRILVYLPTYIAFIAIVGSVLFAITLSTSPKITIYDKSQNTAILRDKLEYQNAAAELLKKSIFNQSKLTINTNSISNQMRSRFPEITFVIVNVPLINRQPNITLVSAKPTLLMSTQSSGAYILDEKGKAIRKLSDVSNAEQLQLLLLSDASGLHINLNQLALSTPSVQFIQEVVGQLSAKGITIQSMTLPTIPQELDVKPQNSNFIIKFNLLNNPRLESGSYLALKQYLDINHITPSQYVDVRVEGRAYYK